MTALQYKLDTMKARALTEEERAFLAKDDEVFVDTGEFNQTVLAPGWCDAAPRTGATAVKTIYGARGLYEKVYVPDENGEELPLIRTAGHRATATVFVPDMEEGELQERVKRALRNEFGAGLVELWNLRTSPTRDLRWDVYFERKELVSVGGPVDGRGQLHWRVVERDCQARGVRDGHHRLFMGKEPKGWSISFELHHPDVSGAEIL
ncbi:hypothetical protein [Streptomyces sp. NPDC059278]|uniref:hypothetical protein n=1 Tax=Streptomyces sp. NPDC059278 TaxID=3346801 RepID=UPI0036D009B7